MKAKVKRWVGNPTTPPIKSKGLVSVREMIAVMKQIKQGGSLKPHPLPEGVLKSPPKHDRVKPDFDKHQSENCVDAKTKANIPQLLNIIQEK